MIIFLAAEWSCMTARPQATRLACCWMNLEKLEQFLINNNVLTAEFTSTEKIDSNILENLYVENL